MRDKKTRKTNEIEDELAELQRLADELNLTALRDDLPALLNRAQDKATSYSAFALEMLRTESSTRTNRRLTRILRRSGLPNAEQGLDTYDFSIRPKLEARVIKELQLCRWIEEEGGRNIICVGRPGMGKTRILDCLARSACRQGYSVLKTTTVDMLEHLHASQADGTFKRAFGRYEKPSVLYLDDFGYTPYDTTATKYLFRLVCARYQKRPILLAANTGFNDWKSFFPSEAQAVATVDRLIDRATILRFSGKPCRAPKEIIGEDTDR
jgi:DNA replication protein DnaC